MSSQDYSREPHGGPRGSAGLSESAVKTAKDAAKDAFSTASSVAGQAAEGIREAASETAATVTSEIKQLLDRQVDGGAQMLGNVARSAKRAAEDLDRDSPQVAGLVRAFASRVDGYANNLRDQSFDQIVKTAADVTRQQPALVFGLAAVAGFVALRALKSSPPMSAPSIQPHTGGYSGARSDLRDL